MDNPVRNSHCLLCHYSLQRCCFFLLIFFLLTTVLIGAVTLIIIFIVKPRRPIFTLQSIRLNSFKLDDDSSSASDPNVYASSIVSLTLNVQNPNKVGLKFRSSCLSVLYEGIPIGSIEVPKFYQPAHSKNVSVQMQVFFDHVNITYITNSLPLEDSSKKSLVKLRIVGNIIAQVRLWHVTLPKIKVALDCQIGVDYRRFISNNGIYSTKKNLRAYSLHKTNSPSFSKKCSLAVYV